MKQQKCGDQGKHVFHKMILLESKKSISVLKLELLCSANVFGKRVCLHTLSRISMRHINKFFVITMLMINLMSFQFSTGGEESFLRQRKLPGVGMVLLTGG
jgi:hypothetical protein